MSKSTYHIKETKNTRQFSYTGDLAEAIEKAKKDLRKEKENPDIQQWEWIKKKAEKAIVSHENKVDRIEEFIKCAERELEKQRKETANNETTAQTGK